MRVHDHNGRTLELTQLLGRGGEGEVYAIKGDGRLVAKILHPPRRHKGKHDKLHAMLKRPPTGAHDMVDGFPVLAWPHALLYTSPDRQDLATFAGYTMTRIQPRDFVPLFQITTAVRRRNLGGEVVTWDRLLLLAARLCHLVRTLHRFGYAIGDLNDRNVLVSRRFTPLLMDTDSFQVPRRIGHFPSLVGDQLYWPPELLGVDLNKHRKSRVQGDRFALATLLFQLLMNGNRPYQARGSAVAGLDTLMAKTQAGHYPWARPVPGVLEPPIGAPDLRLLPPVIQRGFERSFVTGHSRPRRRPSADWWCRELAKESRRGFQTCDMEARHVFSASAPSCPWCADPNDPFTEPKPRPRNTRYKKNPKRTAPRRSQVPPSARSATAAKPSKAAAVTAHSEATMTRPSRFWRWPRRGGGTTGTRNAQSAAGQSTVRQRIVQGAWLVVLLLGLVAPAIWLWSLPGAFEKQVIAAVITVSAGTAPVAWWARRATGDPRIRTALACAWALLVSAAAAAIAATLGWLWLELVAGAVSLAIAATVVVMLERRRGDLRHPQPRSIAHAAAGLPIAHLPSLVLWAWLLVG